MRTLYICYFGISEPLVQTQVLPYLRQLSSKGIDVSLLTFEPDLRRRWTDDALVRERENLSKEGIIWLYLPYHKRPSMPATLYDVIRGAWTAALLARRRKIDVLHARSHVPMAMAMLVRAITGCRTIFDIRGLMADEYADAGIWKNNSLPYRLVKALERGGVRRADHIVVLTRRMRDWLVERDLASPEEIEVIPCCVDFSRFESSRAKGATTSERFEVVYAGSVVGLYLLDEIGRFFLELRNERPGAFLRILTNSPAAAVTEALRSLGLADEDFWVGGARPAEVPDYLRRARLGISFRTPTHSQIAASPTKIPEYLAAGLPVVCNAGIGDTDDLVEREGVGVIVREFSAKEYRRVAARALALASDPEIRLRCERVARSHFDLVEVGGRRYYKVYQRLGAGSLGLESGAKNYSTS